MGKLRWYRRDPLAALDGMANLSLEERGAYNTVLDLIYARDGAVPDDAAFMCRRLGCNVRRWTRIRQRLIDLKKIYVDGGSLRNGRADIEVPQAIARVEQATGNGRRSGEVRGEVSRKFGQSLRKHSRDFAQSSGSDSKENNNLARTNTTESESESLLYDSARASPEGRKEERGGAGSGAAVLSEFEFMTEDGSIFVSGAEMKKLDDDFPGMNARNRFRAGCRPDGWLRAVREGERIAAFRKFMEKQKPREAKAKAQVKTKEQQLDEYIARRRAADKAKAAIEELDRKRTERLNARRGSEGGEPPPSDEGGSDAQGEVPLSAL